MWFNGIKIAFFPKNYKKSPSGLGQGPQTPKSSGGWGPRPKTPVCDTLELHKLSQHVSKVRYLHFSTISLIKPSLFAKSWLSANIGNDFRSSILQYVCPTKSSSFKNFWSRHCTWFVVCPPQSNELEIAWKTFLRTFFFFWRTLAAVSLVLGLGLEHSCPWPRQGLSSERLSLALDFFVSLALVLASSLVSSTPPLCCRP